MKTIDGKSLAAKMRGEIKDGVEALAKETGVIPALAVILVGDNPESEIIAMNYLREHTTEYNETIVSILAKCIHIIPAGASVDLSTNDKAIVLVENPKNYMEPVILRLKDNQIYDLSDPQVSRRFQIVDLMKTMDNRVEIDENTLKQFHADERIKEMTERFRKKSK